MTDGIRGDMVQPRSGVDDVGSPYVGSSRIRHLLERLVFGQSEQASAMQPLHRGGSIRDSW
jgi:hypothetical protein